MSETYENNAIVVAAVNRMLNPIAAMPVTNLDFNNANVRLAYNTLLAISEATQAEDWAFNSFYGFVFTPDSNTKKIPWQNNIIRIHKKGHRFIERDSYLFDIATNNFTFTSPLVVDDVTFQFTFHELPVLIRNYITFKAAREFQIGNNGSDRVDAYLQEKEYEARLAAKDWDLTEGDFNLFKNESVVLANSRRAFNVFSHSNISTSN